MKHALGETPKSILEKGNIDTIYISRQSAEEHFKALIKDKKKIKQIDIIGASLRDFLTPIGALREVWEEIQRRLDDEEKKKLAADDRLHVRLLLLDPQSGEGLFRIQGRKHYVKDSAGLPKDVKEGTQEVFRVQQKILAIRIRTSCQSVFMNIAPLLSCFARNRSFMCNSMTTGTIGRNP